MTMKTKNRSAQTRPHQPSPDHTRPHHTYQHRIAVSQPEEHFKDPRRHTAHFLAHAIDQVHREEGEPTEDEAEHDNEERFGGLFVPRQTAELLHEARFFALPRLQGILREAGVVLGLRGPVGDNGHARHPVVSDRVGRLLGAALVEREIPFIVDGIVIVLRLVKVLLLLLRKRRITLPFLLHELAVLGRDEVDPVVQEEHHGKWQEK